MRKTTKQEKNTRSYNASVPEGQGKTTISTWFSTQYNHSGEKVIINQLKGQLVKIEEEI